MLWVAEPHALSVSFIFGVKMGRWSSRVQVLLLECDEDLGETGISWCPG